MALTVKELIKRLKEMPQDEQVGIAQHDYEDGVSDGAFSVNFISDSDVESGKPMHRVVISS
ncbi:hypothetical protein [Pseudoalteromonas peptidolytica]|uniref:Uncharacterized protein n=1 Tax=Pseudoalteromonas peptidolytica F12-50-A1 TaxID=1315280 RepID=A0A8I0MYA7_9GAMM|nr:hypothetical protein [Pseudoalteromonas peptidolytica]MBE0348234.1 hypothetical protein [Pseudoalteromonas peptidolytica F12-50-A1]NLR16596.1 hypothetical protein [Pseudoalteromonas peptidolytica]GEK11881.1 hypothetical protein PPE03_41300 [Pseudoalteromonas peptidolytica]